MTAHSRALRLEMEHRAIYLATGLEVDFWRWIDAGMIRLGIDELESEMVRVRYLI